MSPMQHELYARTVLADHRRQVARYRATGSTDRAWRDRVGAAMVGTGDRLRDAGRRLQHVPESPALVPCADA